MEKDKIISLNRPIVNREKPTGFQKIVDELLSEVRIEPSKSLWCHAVVIVKKKSGI